MVLTRRAPHAGCAPLPLVGRGWGWGSRDRRADVGERTTPLPNPPPQGGEGADRVRRSRGFHVARPRPRGCDLSAPERRGSHVAESGRARVGDAARELVELHLVDTIGALIASTRTVEGASLLRFRAAMRARGQGAWALDLATRCALARLSEI